MPLNSRYARNIRARRIVEQKGLCCYCKQPFTATGARRATLEHRKARMDGGRDNVANLAAACWQCNQLRGKQMVQHRQKAKAADGGAGHSA